MGLLRAVLLDSTWRSSLLLDPHPQEDPHPDGGGGGAWRSSLLLDPHPQEVPHSDGVGGGALTKRLRMRLIMV